MHVCEEDCGVETPQSSSRTCIIFLVVGWVVVFFSVSTTKWQAISSACHQSSSLSSSSWLCSLSLVIGRKVILLTHRKFYLRIVSSWRIWWDWHRFSVPKGSKSGTNDFCCMCIDPIVACNWVWNQIYGNICKSKYQCWGSLFHVGSWYQIEDGTCIPTKHHAE